MSELWLCSPGRIRPGSREARWTAAWDLWILRAARDASRFPFPFAFTQGRGRGGGPMGPLLHKRGVTVVILIT
jgi:hypothetical protein